MCHMPGEKLCEVGIKALASHINENQSSSITVVIYFYSLIEEISVSRASTSIKSVYVLNVDLIKCISLLCIAKYSLLISYFFYIKVLNNFMFSGNPWLH